MRRTVFTVCVLTGLAAGAIGGWAIPSQSVQSPGYATPGGFAASGCFALSITGGGGGGPAVCPRATIWHACETRAGGPASNPALVFADTRYMYAAQSGGYMEGFLITQPDGGCKDQPTDGGLGDGGTSYNTYIDQSLTAGTWRDFGGYGTNTWAITSDGEFFKLHPTVVGAFFAPGYALNFIEVDDGADAGLYIGRATGGGESDTNLLRRNLPSTGDGGKFNLAGGARPGESTQDTLNNVMYVLANTTIQAISSNGPTDAGVFDAGMATRITFSSGVAGGQPALWGINLDDKVVKYFLDGGYVGAYDAGPAIDGLAFASNQIWVSNSTLGTITALDPNTGAVVDTFDAGCAHPKHMFYLDNRVFVACTSDDTVLSICAP